MLTILIISVLTTTAIYAFCCENAGQWKCYTTGECCGGDWYESCNDFEIYTSGARAFRIGQKTHIILYIKNTGAYEDTYTLTAISNDPTLILVDMTGATNATVSPSEIRKLFPRITVLSNTATGNVIFTAESSNGDKESTTLVVLESGDYLSLPEFSIFGLVQLFFIAGIVYYFLTRKQKI